MRCGHGDWGWYKGPAGERRFCRECGRVEWVDPGDAYARGRRDAEAELREMVRAAIEGGCREREELRRCGVRLDAAGQRRPGYEREYCERPCTVFDWKARADGYCDSHADLAERPVDLEIAPLVRWLEKADRA